MRDDHEITSEVLDGLLDTVPTLRADRLEGGTAVSLYVAVDPPTLRELQQRAAAEGTDLGSVAADALRAGAHAP
jgi:hypothetical protein